MQLCMLLNCIHFTFIIASKGCHDCACTIKLKPTLRNKHWSCGKCTHIKYARVCCVIKITLSSQTSSIWVRRTIPAMIILNNLFKLVYDDKLDKTNKRHQLLVLTIKHGLISLNIPGGVLVCLSNCVPLGDLTNNCVTTGEDRPLPPCCWVRISTGDAFPCCIGEARPLVRISGDALPSLGCTATAAGTGVNSLPGFTLSFGSLGGVSADESISSISFRGVWSLRIRCAA